MSSVQCLFPCPIASQGVTVCLDETGVQKTPALHGPYQDLVEWRFRFGALLQSCKEIFRIDSTEIRTPSRIIIERTRSPLLSMAETPSRSTAGGPTAPAPSKITHSKALQLASSPSAGRIRSIVAPGPSHLTVNVNLRRIPETFVRIPPSKWGLEPSFSFPAWVSCRGMRKGLRLWLP